MSQIGPGALAHAGATQHRADVREQHARLDRLGDELVGAQLEAQHAVEVLVARGEDHDRRGRAARAQLAADVEAVAPRQHHVEHDQVGLELVGALDRQVAAPLDVHLEPVPARGTR